MVRLIVYTPAILHAVTVLKKVSEFVEGLINKDGETEKTDETDVPEKTGHWSLLYSPEFHDTTCECSVCGFKFEINGRATVYSLAECPNCKAKMEARSDV